MNYEGSLHLVWMNRGTQSELQCNVMFADYRSGGGTMKQRTVIGESALRRFLTGQVRAHSDHVDAALKELHEKGSAGVQNVLLSAEELRDLGLK
jgi:hypothetical protein